jgi:hypothetical protein
MRLLISLYKLSGKQEAEPWYLSTNLPDISTMLEIYHQGFGIEAMFKDCKIGGYVFPDKLVCLTL